MTGLALSSQISACFCLLCAEIKGACNHTWPQLRVLRVLTLALASFPSAVFHSQGPPGSVGLSVHGSCVFPMQSLCCSHGFCCIFPGQWPFYQLASGKRLSHPCCLHDCTAFQQSSVFHQSVIPVAVNSSSGGFYLSVLNF